MRAIQCAIIFQNWTTFTNFRPPPPLDSHPRCSREIQTPRHVLSSSTVSLEQGRYSYRHNLLLQELATHLLKFPYTSKANFDIPGLRNPPDWMVNDLSLLRPDGWVQLKNVCEYIIDFFCHPPSPLAHAPTVPFLYQSPGAGDTVRGEDQREKILIIELTIPWEENLAEAHRRKRNKYSQLMFKRRAEKVPCCSIVFEIGACLMPNTTSSRVSVPFHGEEEASSCVQHMIRSAIFGSYVIWTRREDPAWSDEPREE